MMSNFFIFFIFKFFNVENLTDVKYPFYLILQDILGVICNTNNRKGSKNLSENMSGHIIQLCGPHGCQA